MFNHIFGHGLAFPNNICFLEERHTFPFREDNLGFFISDWFDITMTLMAGCWETKAFFDFMDP